MQLGVFVELFWVGLSSAAVVVVCWLLGRDLVRKRRKDE
jgi:hypothetical protein